MNVDLAGFQICLSIITRYGKQYLIYGIEATWTSHGLELIWVLAVVISKVHVYEINIYKPPINYIIKRASKSNSPKISFGRIISFKRHWRTYDYHDKNYTVELHIYPVRSCSPSLTHKIKFYFGCQPDEPLASLVTTNRIINVYVFLVVIMLLMYSVLHCLYSVGNKTTTTITTTTTTTTWQ